MKIDLSDNAIGEAGANYVLGSMDEQPIPPNGFSYKGMRLAIKAYFRYVENKENEKLYND